MIKKIFFIFVCVGFSLAAFAETLKMKDGSLVSGSILSQTEYTLNLATSYGNITLNQREIEEILPDKHRLILKGGSQLVGIITDMDEFNLKLQTDDGALVNIDVPQIVSIEAYDYDRGQHAQQEFVEHKIEQQAAQASALTAATAVSANASQTTVPAAGGLTFDSDINQVFNAQKATVVNGQVQTPHAQVVPAPTRSISDEEAFLKNVKAGAITQQEYATKAKEELLAKNAKKKAPKKEPIKHIEKNYSKYFSVQAGAMPLDLQASGKISLGSAQRDLGSRKLDVGGTSIAISSKFLWRIKESNLWLGPTAFFANIESKDFSYADSTGSIEARSNGTILSLGAAAHYYLNPTQRFAVYLTAAAQYEMLCLKYNGEITLTTPTSSLPFSNSISSNGPSGSAGIGVETWVDDVMIGAEVRQVFASRQDELKKSAASNTIIQAQLSWKF